MRKMLCTLLALSVLALAAGLAVPAGASSAVPAAIATPTPIPAATNCTFSCSCNGTPLQCCTVNGKVFCVVSHEFECPQVDNC